MERKKVKGMTNTALMAALLCVLGPIIIPMQPIPFSMQVFAVFLAVCILGAKNGTIAVVMYLLIGIIGVPVFAGFSGGAGCILAPAGGFLIGFVPMAIISGIFIDKFPNHIVIQFIGMFLGLVVLYIFGTAWLIILTKFPLEKALRAAVYPFVALDSIKGIIAMLISRIVKKRLGGYIF